MKIFLMLVLVLHILMEGIVGLVLMFSPQTMVPDVDSAGLPYLIYYGAAGITLSLAVAWFWPHRNNRIAAGIVLGILATFHTALTVAGGIVVSQGGGLNIIASHGVMAICLWILWSRRENLTAS